MKITLTEKQIKKIVEHDRHMKMARAWVAGCLKNMESKVAE